MKRRFLGLGILGLAGIIGLSVSAQGQIKIFDSVYNVNPLWQPNLAAGNPLVGVGTVYREAVNGTSGDQSAQTTPGSGGSTQVAPFQIVTDPDDTRYGWLDGGDSTSVGLGDGYDDTNGTAPWLMLTGDPAWADVTLTTKAIMWEQNDGALLLVLRAAPKTQLSDPNSYYALELGTGNSNVLASMQRDGLIAPNDTSTNDDGSSEACVLRILKRVNGTWTQLAEVNQDQTNVHIPRINRLGHDHDVNHGQGSTSTDELVGGYFQFTAKGNTLTGNVSMDGQTFTKVIEATDTATDALKAGLVGFASWDIEPCFKNIQVTPAQ
jgi:hypothetical protein